METNDTGEALRGFLVKLIQATKEATYGST
jgi:hypothetical protein